QVRSSVATVIPEIGLLDDPIWPVSCDDTVENRKPNTRIRKAPTRFMCSGAATVIAAMIATQPTSTHFMGMSRSVRDPASGALDAEPNPLRPETMLLQIAGSARARATTPPAATAPAPM